MKTEKRGLLPVVAAILGNMFWGFSFLFTRVALQETTPELMLAIRFIISFALMNIPILLGRQKLQLRGKKLLPLLADYDVTVLPGISSLVYFCTRLGISYENVRTVSIHGRE